MPQTKSEVLQETYLATRAKILEVAAILDRIDLAKSSDGPIEDDPRFQKIRQAIDVLIKEAGDTSRAEQIQLLFSRPYDAKWTESFQLMPRK